MLRSHSLVALVLALVSWPAEGQLTAQIRLEPDGGRHFDVPPTSAGDPIEVRDFLAGDLDGDGDEDLVIIGLFDAPVLLNDGSGVLAWSRTPWPSGGRQSSGVLFDADGDGDLDLFGLPGDPLGYGTGGQPGIVFNDGTGSLTRNWSRTVPQMQVNGLLVFAEDIDGDGDMDLTMVHDRRNGTAALNAVLVWENDGTGSFTDATAARAPGLGLFVDRALHADLDGNGHQDLILEGWPTSVLLMHDGVGAYVDRTNLLQGVAGIGGSAAGDVDGDGDVDLLTPSAFLLNDGTGTSYTNSPHGASIVGSDVRIVGDLDGDGRADVLAVDVERALSVYLQTSPGTLVDATTAWVEPHVNASPPSRLHSMYTTITRLLARDFDGDGDLDVVLGGAEGRYSSFTVGVPPKLLINAGGRRFVDGSRERLEAGDNRSTSAVATGDIDGDGDVDVVFGEYGSLVTAPSHVYRNDGTGFFEPSPGSWAGSPAIAIQLVDLDGDGDLDLVEANGLGQGPWGPVGSRAQNRLGLNDGNGVFTDVTATHLPALQDVTSDLAIGDVDGDGDPDIATTEAITSANAVRVLRNDGTARFTLAASPPIPAIEAWSVELEDFDGDGDPDLVISATTGLHYLTNDGLGTYVEETAARIPNASQWGGFGVVLSSVDIDGDGDIDIAHGGGLLRNDGTGVFTQAPCCGSTLYYGTRFADLDEDGLPEAIGPGTRVRVDGNYVYSGGQYTSVDAIGIADVDGDGDLDLFVPSRADGGGLHFDDTTPRFGLLINLRRQLRAPTLARLGQVYPLVVHGTDRSTSEALVAVGIPAPPTRIAGVGDLRLDPSTLILAPGVILASGPAGGIVPVPIPNTPSLAGIVFGAQALVWHGGQVHTARLTNAVVGEIYP